MLIPGLIFAGRPFGFFPFEVFSHKNPYVEKSQFLLILEVQLFWQGESEKKLFVIVGSLTWSNASTVSLLEQNVFLSSCSVLLLVLSWQEIFKLAVLSPALN